MPEYLAPGVFVEEVSFRSKSIEGVPTSTTGFAGMTSYGPVYYLGGPKNCEPRLITSFTEYERVYGRMEKIYPGSTDPGEERDNYMALAAKAFFDNGGKRLYISRVFVPRAGDDGVAEISSILHGTPAGWQARWPGYAGDVRVDCIAVRSRNIAYQHTTHGVQAKSAKKGAVVEVVDAADTANPPKTDDPLDLTKLLVVEVDSDGKQIFVDQAGTEVVPAADAHLQLVELTVRVTVNDERIDEYAACSTSPLQKRYLGKILEMDDPEDENAVVAFLWDKDAATPPQARFLAADLMKSLHDNGGRLDGGNDGLIIDSTTLQGDEADPDDSSIKATGLEALGEIEDIAIVAAPDAGSLEADMARASSAALVDHAEKYKYRIAVVDGPANSSINEIREFRSQFDSTRAALYHPWIEVYDPVERPAQGAPPRRILLPPSGFVTGIYARSDIARGVHKAPANEIVRGLTRFEANINKPRQEVLNPEGINALRFFEGRGHRVWGARTMSSDPEWKYVNVRRLFIFIEHSIEKSTQWAVFEPNNQRLWDNVRRAIEDFLLVLWRDGALMGDKPEQAFFVRCDRSTMTQNDIDNGRMICLIGVAPTKPAEFVIFRIGQWTADSQS